MTGRLVADALNSRVPTVLLSADDDDVAPVHERLGFVRFAVSCVADG